MDFLLPTGEFQIYNKIMKVSAQEEYGLRCLLQMARNSDAGSLSIPEISRAEGLSGPNVAKLMRILRLGGLVRSVRGKSGGYRLARAADRVTIEQVLRVLGGPAYGPHFCARHAGIEDGCPHKGDCAMRPVWRKIQEMMSAILINTTLQDLLRSEEEMKDWLAGIDFAGGNGKKALSRATAV
jgi:Rrf2 family transcriptional regulator, iron-sulfur cluster assembly transcription factor